jgi:DNA-binding transcriptional MerR regulator
MAKIAKPQNSNIKKVAAELGVSTSKLRFWESKFSLLKPERRGSNSNDTEVTVGRGRERHYSNEDIELIKDIIELVEVKKMKLEGAAEVLEQRRTYKAKIKQAIEGLEHLRQYLTDWKEMIG